MYDPSPGYEKKLAKVQPQGKDLVFLMLEKDPLRRLSLIDAERHKFFRNGYCPTSLPENVFEVPPTFISEDKCKVSAEEEGLDVEDTLANKKMRRYPCHTTNSGCRGKGKEVLRVPVQDDVSILKQ